MVHGQERCFWPVPLLELGEAFRFVFHFSALKIACNVSLLSVSTSRI